MATQGEDSDDEEFFFYGTPIEDEAETQGYRKRVKDAGTTRALPVWQQEATDEQGRKVCIEGSNGYMGACCMGTCRPCSSMHLL